MERQVKRMNYDTVIDLDNVTWEECINLYKNEHKVTILNDGRIINFEEEG